ncbi:Cytochrome P450 monooxygenase COX1 [Colletotrichum orbiculare MAFF 240422]|uniref:Cytochrome P450 monooxygenase COX1 n=1 Tax=Colletotrichum orbiculare (strain 104-T / ATCC 96160 / CBS 514.97 / LARS 414 / MAFF 240422) TaxID=1213857 RepID=N4VNW7_COLOR|nr:Cytochrome P450 monooxygenase COX1 [Colletotrichum orbiculare MAFF 240422]
MESFALVAFYLGILLVPGFIFSSLRRFSGWHSKTAAEGKPAAKPAKFPGPKQYPIVGRVHDLPKVAMWLKLKEWADEFGPIYQTSMMGQKFVVISDEELAQDLLVKNGNNFAGRPQIRALIDHKLGPAYAALMDRHDTWKYQRKWVHAAMASAYQHHFYGHIESEVKRWLVTLLLDPEKFHGNTRELTGRIVSRLAWDDASQGKAYGDSAIETLTQMSVSGPVVNTATPIWHVADLVRYNPWRAFEVERERNQRAWWLRTFRAAKARYRGGELPGDTWACRYFDQLRAGGNETLEQPAKDEDFAACMLGFQCLVGVVTISGPMQFFLMCMALHPEWLKRCQREIDAVCGHRMPTRDDFAELPTVRACLKETLRWRSGVPLGVPHQCEKDSEFQGVKIEKGTIILACEWNINRVPEKYPDPEHYRPDRYLDPGFPTYQEPLSRYPNFRDGVGMHTFGWGRRTCLGQNLVDDEMLVAAAAVCWAFDMGLKKCPATGEDVTFDTQATNSNVILEPLPFPMQFKIRSSARAQAVLDGYSSVRSGLRV